MNLTDIIKTLQINLPKYTDKFTSSSSVSSLTLSGSTVTAVTGSAHGLTTGDAVNITGATTPNPMTGLTQTGGVGRLVTQFNHDITRNTPLQAGDSSTVTISNATESEYNGTFTILSVTNSNVIEFSISAAAPASSTGGQLDEDISIFYNGRYTITVIDTTTFTYEITDTPTTNTASGTIVLNAGYRISGDKTIDHALMAYSNQSLSDWWCFAVIGDALVSKQRVGNTDGISTRRKGQDLRQQIIQNLNIYLIRKNTADFTSITAIDDIYELRPYVLKSFHLSPFGTGLEDNNMEFVYTGDTILVGEKDAFYIHQFSFQGEIWTSNNDGVDPAYTKALREFDLQTLNEFEEIITQVEGELPDEKASS